MGPRILHNGQAQQKSYNFLVGNELNLLNGLKLTHDTILLDANDSNQEWHKCGADSRLGIRCGTSILD